MRIHLGDKVRDKISGVTGIVVARAEFLYGCVRCSVQPQELKDGKPIEVTSFDEPQLELIERRAIVDAPHWRESLDVPAPRQAAGPRDDVTRQPDVRRD